MCYERRVQPAVTSVTSTEESRSRPAWTRKVAPWVATVLAGLFGAWIALNVAGTTQTQIGPLNVDADIAPAWTGETTVRVDPLGTLVFDTHTAPLQVTLSLRAVDVDAVQRIVEHPTALNALEAQLVDDLDDALTKAAIRAAVVAIIGAVIAGGLVLRSWRRALLSGAVALTAIAASYALTLVTFDRQAIQEPHYTGLLTMAPRVVGSAEAITADFGAYIEQLGSLITNVSRIYETAIALPTWAPTDDTIRVLLVADLHLNPAAWGVIRSVSNQYDVDVIVDAGDIADHGTAPEARYVEPISTLGRPYLFVKGNHDSVLIVRAIEAQENAIVLEGRPVTVAGLRFLGAPDPRFTPDQQTRGTAAEDLRQATVELAERARSLPTRADVLVFHDPTHADLFQDTAPLVLAGHAHRRRDIVLDDDTRIFVQGSTGGAGLRGLEGEEPTPVTLSVLYFDPTTKGLLAWDDITLGGLGLSSAEIRRTQIDDGLPSEPDDLGEVAPTPTP
jgi:predicted phosphodiesterase